MKKQPLLQIQNLTTRFNTQEGAVHAVNDVSLTVHEGELLAIVGESGSGKSVTMLSIMGLIPQPPGEIVAGKVLFEDQDLIPLSNKEMQRIRGKDIAMIFQDPMSSLNPVLTIGHQISEALMLHLDLSRSAAEKRTTTLLDLVGIPDAAARIHDYPHQFSGGMRQRVMIAMALSCEPKLLIADEPTTALDVTIQAQIVALVKRLQAEFGMTVIWITHDLGVVANLADRVAVMYAGRIIETGQVDSIYAHSRHPYTLGLLGSVPRLNEDVPTTLQEIRGNPPDLLQNPTSCAFAPRCFMAVDGCQNGVPPLTPTDIPSLHSACFYWDVIAEKEKKTAVSITPHIETSTKTESNGVLVRVEGLKTYFPIRKGIFQRVVGNVRAVDGVDLTIHRGETVGLVGESGCGKTTLGRTVLQLYQPSAGNVSFDGQDLNALNKGDLQRIRRRMQMIFQDPFSSMHPGMKVWQIIGEPLQVHGVSDKAERQARAAELLERVGLKPTHIDRYPHEFSGGQRQRIVIARALALNPDFIICDEPVSSLDVSIQAQIVNLLEELQADLGLTYLFIAHDLALVRHISDRIAVMYLGKIAELTDRDMLYRNPLHPYTKALLGSIPLPDPVAERKRERMVLQGDLPSPAAPPSGCRFHTRCPIAQRGTCDVTEPEIRELQPGHWVACHLV
jgi:peptide/nickel transport system ATP-binding protein